MFSSLTLCSQTEEKRGRVATLIQLKHLQEAFSGCHIEAALLPQHGTGDPRAHGHGFAQQYPSGLFLVAGSCLVSAGPGLRPWAIESFPEWPSLALYSGEKWYADLTEGLCVTEF